ncbi:MAG: hypothetical protein K0B07_03195 [DPANN group archaeon]|nr:hypothetical protein [DPANN group archaeon]MCK5593732.1 hypothetical protein [Candidatus Aenigmarchaeota archaeon]NOQ55265.1 hypothetical protein [Candidatus Nanohaloarchaea archaeon]
MVEFVTVKEDEVKFGDNNFFEIASKKAVTDEGEKPFISITRGYYKDGKDKKFTKVISIPHDGETLKKVVDVLDSFVA